jgi:hypothetical protein
MEWRAGKTRESGWAAASWHETLRLRAHAKAVYVDALHLAAGRHGPALHILGLACHSAPRGPRRVDGGAPGTEHTSSATPRVPMLAAARRAASATCRGLRAGRQLSARHQACRLQRVQASRIMLAAPTLRPQGTRRPCRAVCW